MPKLGPDADVLLESLFARAPVGLALLDRDLRFLRVNARMAAYNGRAPEEHLGRRVHEVLPELHPKALAAMREVLATGEPVEALETGGLSARRPDEGYLHFNASYVPLQDAAGAVVGVGALVAESTHARRSLDAERLGRELASFLADASVALDGSLELDETLAAVGRIVVPRLADWFAIDVLEEDGTLRRASVSHVDPERVRRGREFSERHPARPEDPHGSGLVVRTGEPELLEDVSGETLEAIAAGREDYAETMRSLGLRSSLTLPLRARGRVLGAMALVHAESGRRFDLDDVAVATHLASRVALALDNARAYRESRGAHRQADEALALLDTLFETAPVGLAFFDRELRYVRINDKLAAINGVPAAEHIGRTVSEVLPDMDPRVVEDFRRAVDSGEPIVDAEVVGQTPAAPGRTRHWLASYYPVFGPEGQALGLGAVVNEVTERKRAERERERLLQSERRARAEAEAAHDRAAFLAEASGVLDESLELDATLRSVGHLVVPRLADWFAVDLLKPDGAIRRVAAAHADPTRERLALELAERFPAAREDAAGTGRSIRTGCAELLPELPDAVIDRLAGGRPAYAESLRELGLQSTIVVPLAARGRTLGAMVLATSESGRRFGHEQLSLAEELAGRLGLAIDNARLYRERAETARTLQAGLLPPLLPSIPGLDLAAVYRAAGEGNDVGGDFYDVFPTGDGSWASFIGDVCGKGPEAAVVTALARYTMRAAALHEARPAGVLRVLNDAMLHQHHGDEFCTAVFLHIDEAGPGAARLTLCVAGHPPPLVLRADGSVEKAGERGTLVGVVADPVLTDVEVALGPGDVLLLYTDGVTEARVRHWELGEEGLVTLVDAGRGRAAIELVEHVERTVVSLQGGEARDDIALVALRVPG